MIRDNHRKKEKPNIIYGRHPVLDAIKTGTAVDKLVLQQGIRGEFEKEVRSLAKKFNIPLQVIPKERLNKITNKNHQGLVAYISMMTYYRLDDVLPNIYEQATPLILVLDGVTDVRNFGAIARTAECAGVQTIVIPKKGAAQINADAMKTSAGALASMTVCREQSLMSAIELLQLSGVQIVAAELHGDKALHEIDFSLPTAIIMGSEGKGIHKTLLDKSDVRFKIPQVGTTNSYNVSVAAGMILYESLRQKLV